MNRKATLPISAAVTFGTITLASIENNGQLPGTREWLGFVIVFTMLSVGVDLGIPIAGGFAILVMLTVLLTRGVEALEFLTGKLGTDKRKTRKPKGQIRPGSPMVTQTDSVRKV